MSVRVYVEPSGRRVSPFDDPVSEVLIANRPLGDWLAEAITTAGLERIDQLQPPCLVVPDTLFTTPEVLRRFVKGAEGGDAVLVLAASTFGERSTALQPGVTALESGWRFTAIRFVSGRDEPAVDVVIDPEEQVIELDVPAAFTEGQTPSLALATHPVMTVHHWSHILGATQASGAAELRAIPKWKGALRLLGAAIRARSINKWKVMARLNTIGKGCDIHPTAVVEGSTLGEGVTVGPFARVLFSRLGDGASVMPGAHVEASTLGEGAAVAQMCGVRACVLYPEAFSGSGMTQVAVLGRRAVTTAGTYMIDLNLEREIRVPLDGELHGSGTQFLGCAIGHRARIGTGVWMASGREIPNDAVVVRDPDLVIQRIGPGVGEGTWTCRQGVLVQL